MIDADRKGWFLVAVRGAHRTKYYFDVYSDAARREAAALRADGYRVRIGWALV